MPRARIMKPEEYSCHRDDCTRCNYTPKQRNEQGIGMWAYETGGGGGYIDAGNMRIGANILTFFGQKGFGRFILPSTSFE